MRYLRFLISLGIAILSNITLIAQVSEDERLGLFVIAETQDSSVNLRWVPTNMMTWNWGIENGYRIARFTLANNGIRDSIPGMIASKVLLDSLILPLPENDWSNVDATADQIDLAKGSIYAPSFIVDSMLDASSLARAFTDQADRESRYIFGLFAADQKFAVAKAMGFGYKDTTALPNMEYYYSIEILGDLDSNTIRLFGVEVDMNDTIDLPVPLLAHIVEATDSSVMISCDVSFLRASYVSYYFERSSDSITFDRVNELPIVTSETDEVLGDILYFTDHVDSVNTWYYYRYFGMTPFGTAGPASPVLKLKTSPSPKASSPIISELTLVGENVKVDWTFPSIDEDYISKFRIYRANNLEGPYNLLDSVAVTIRTWTDDHPIISGYYRVAAYDNSLVEVYASERFIQLPDSIPPDAPSGLVCTIDMSGAVQVKWTPVDDPGLEGYRVFSGNDLEGIYGEETTFLAKDTAFSFLTNLQTLSEKVYIKVQAVDVRQNYSAYSEPCTAIRPDLIPPSRPILVKADPLVTGVYLEWINSSSSDVSSHTLQRSWENEVEWVDLIKFDTIGTIIGTPNGVIVTAIDSVMGKLRDTTAAYPQDYKYRIIAVDNADNISSSEILTVRPYDSGLRGLITNLEIDSTYDAQLLHDVNILTWNYTHLEGLYDFQVYRSVDKKPMRAYATTNGRGGINFSEVAASSGLSVPASGAFTWKDVHLGTAKLLANSGVPGAIPSTPLQRKFKYKIMARHFDGGWSPESEVVEIEVWVPGE